MPTFAIFKTQSIQQNFSAIIAEIQIDYKRIWEQKNVQKMLVKLTPVAIKLFRAVIVVVPQ
jgi:hypothetical protein